MTIDHATFADRLDDLDNLDNLPADLADHANACTACAQRLDLARRIRSAARDLRPQQPAPTSATEMRDNVLQQTRRRRWPTLAAAAAVVAVVGTVGIIAIQLDDQDNDVLADIADNYRTSNNGARFVLATEATIDLNDILEVTTPDPDDIEPLAAELPTCTDPQDGTTPPTDGLDLSPIVDALTSDNPCDALALIDNTITDATAKRHNELATSAQLASRTLDAIDNQPDGTDLLEASLDAYRHNTRQHLDNNTAERADLTTRYESLARSLQPVATGTALADDDLVALQQQLTDLTDTLTAAPETTTPSATITWTQIATGTWTPTDVTITGTTERTDTTLTYDSVNDDPLGLAAIVFDDPDQLPQILDSAPTNPDDNTTIEWTVPPALIDTPGPWTATATLRNNDLDTLTLTSPTTTITLTPAR